MSGGQFHVHGPHDHEVEHAAAHADRDALAGRVAVTTAILATVAAIFSYVSGSTQASAGIYKNDAAIRKTEAANQWAYFQAKSTKENVAEVAMIGATPEARAVLGADVARYREEKSAIEAKARELEAEAAEFDRRSGEQMHAHHRWAQATTAMQIAIAMAAIALITRRRWLHGLVHAFAGTGLVLGALAIAHV
jgi:hypothetical protein